MPDSDTLRARVRAVERVLTDADSLPDLDALEELDGLAARVARVEDRLDALDGDVQALRGYVGHVEETESRPSADGVPVRRADVPHPVPDFEPVEADEPTPSLRERLAALL